MTGALVLTGALMGLAATPHCVAMCAAPCAAAARACSAGDHHAFGVWPILLGRLAAYAAVGAVAATLVGSTRWVADSAQWLRPLWAMLQAGILVFGVWLLWQGRMPRGWDRIGGSTAAESSSLPGGTVALPWPVRARRAAAGLGMGALWVAIPCGVLHAAILVAALASTSAEGAGVMAAFSLTSSLALVAGPRLWAGVARLGGTRSAGVASGAAAGGLVSGSLALRAAGLTLSLMALWSLGHMIADPQAPLC